MKKKVLILLAGMSISFAGIASATQTIHFDNKSSKSPSVRWLSPHSEESILISTTESGYSFLITVDRVVNGNKGCAIDLDGCRAGTSGTALGMEPGDIFLCKPVSDYIFINSRCKAVSSTGSYAAAGTVKFIKD
ncbi:MAG: hypothetical protein ACYCQI_16735 [Gammaproteobacteria bacterium]